MLHVLPSNEILKLHIYLHIPSFISSHFLHVAAPDDTSPASHGGCADHPKAGHFWGQIRACNDFSDLWIANFLVDWKICRGLDRKGEDRGLRPSLQSLIDWWNILQLAHSRHSLSWRWLRLQQHRWCQQQHRPGPFPCHIHFDIKSPPACGFPQHWPVLLRNFQMAFKETNSD